MSLKETSCEKEVAQTVHIRRLATQQELQDATNLEAEIWGAGDPTPRSLLVVFSHHGGVVTGAYDGDRLVGVSLGFPGIDAAGVTYLHSHLLGVRPEYRRHRLGESLKRAQWQFAEEKGLPYIGWTYDPLMAPNAWFNLAVLGAEVRDVWENVYGTLDDAINGTMPTHRFWVVWNAKARPRSPQGGGEHWRMDIPSNVAALRRDNPEAARRQAEQFFQDSRRLWEGGWRIAGAGRDASGVWYDWVQEPGKDDDA